jgi:queuine tRNA-ribosyltransferase
VRPLDEDCKCPACARFSRAYLRHLFQAQEILAHRLVSIHNITHLARLMDATRAAIREGTFSLLREAVEGRLEGQVSLAPG